MIALAAVLALAVPAWGIDADRLKKLLDGLASEKNAEREESLVALHKEATAKDVPALLKASDDKRERVRAGILFAMGKFWNIPLTEPYPVPEGYFLKASKDASPQVRAHYPGICFGVLKRYPKLYPSLLACLDDRAPCGWGDGYPQTVASQATRVMGWLGRAAKPGYAKVVALAQAGRVAPHSTVMHLEG
ncbi:MAG: hypothetical protein K2W96_05805 [Gemmataceae bacterium]|nr:hypothetical protein [Gemmataceae bacterium]